MENTIRELLRSLYRFWRTFCMLTMRPLRSYRYLLNEPEPHRFFTEPTLFFILTSFLFATVIRDADKMVGDANWEDLRDFIRSVNATSAGDALLGTLPILLVTAIEIPLLGALLFKKHRGTFMRFFLYLTSFQKLWFFIMVLFISLVLAIFRSYTEARFELFLFSWCMLLGGGLFATVMPFVIVLRSIKKEVGKGTVGAFIFVSMLLPANFFLFVYIENAYNSNKMQPPDMLYSENKDGVTQLRQHSRGNNCYVETSLAFVWKDDKDVYVEKDNAFIFEFPGSVIDTVGKEDELEFKIESIKGDDGPIVSLKRNEILWVKLTRVMSKQEYEVFRKIVLEDNKGRLPYVTKLKVRDWTGVEYVHNMYDRGTGTVALVEEASVEAPVKGMPNSFPEQQQMQKQEPRMAK